MSAGTLIFVLVVIVVVGWFALGTHINVRKGHRFLDWLQGGLPLIGEKTTVRWLGSSVVQLKIENAHEPFRRAEVLVVLEPRDVPLLWLYSRMHNRRDLLIVRAQLRSQPTLQLEILDAGAWSTQAVAQEVKQLNWHLQAPLDNQPFQVYASGPVVEAAELIHEATRCALPLVRVGIRQSDYNLEVQCRLSSPPSSSARAVMEDVRRIAHKV